jgi:chromosome partitioning protein
MQANIYMSIGYKCILVGGEKGGTGKSTVATNLAAMLKIAGYDTHLVDCDKQQTSVKFASRRAAKEIPPPLVATCITGDQLQIPIADLAEKYDVVVIDCGGQDSVELRSAMITPCVDLMIIPIQAGYFDLETLVNMDQLVRTSRIYNQNLVAKCLINRAPTNKQVTVADEARDFIREELGNLGLFETVLHDRISYSYAVAKGECILEYEQRARRDGKASAEFLELYKEITGDTYPVEKIGKLAKLEVK